MVNTSWLKISKPGLYVLPAKAHIDPIRGVDTAIITHGHSDHARPGHKHVIATKQTLAIMSARYGENFANQKTALTYNDKFTLNINQDLDSIYVEKDSDIFKNIFFYTKVIQNAKEIHCINSSFIHLVDRIAVDKPLFYHKIRHSNVFLSDKWQVVNY